MEVLEARVSDLHDHDGLAGFGAVSKARTTSPGIEMSIDSTLPTLAPATRTSSPGTEGAVVETARTR